LGDDALIWRLREGFPGVYIAFFFPFCIILTPEKSFDRTFKGIQRDQTQKAHPFRDWLPYFSLQSISEECLAISVELRAEPMHRLSPTSTSECTWIDAEYSLNGRQYIVSHGRSFLESLAAIKMGYLAGYRGSSMAADSTK
jgi:hypothetical protein